MKLNQPETLSERIARAGGVDIGEVKPQFFLTATGRNKLVSVTELWRQPGRSGKLDLKPGALSSCPLVTVSVVNRRLQAALLFPRYSLN